MSKARTEPAREELIRSYKTILQDVVDRRPSGLRLKIAQGIGRNKSFVSQITSPHYASPIPRKHLDLIFELAHFTPEEKTKFLDCYRRAHPRVAARVQSDVAAGDDHRVLEVDLPRLDSAALEARVDQLVRDFARRVSTIVKTRK